MIAGAFLRRVGGAELTAPGCQKKPKIYLLGTRANKCDSGVLSRCVGCESGVVAKAGKAQAASSLEDERDHSSLHVVWLHMRAEATK